MSLHHGNHSIAFEWGVYIVADISDFAFTSCSLTVENSLTANDILRYPRDRHGKFLCKGMFLLFIFNYVLFYYLTIFSLLIFNYFLKQDNNKELYSPYFNCLKLTKIHCSSFKTSLC